jgi:hypothetical protein
MIHNVTTNRIPPGIIIAVRRLSVLITAHVLKTETDRVPSEDLDPRYAPTICSITLCDLVLCLPHFLPSPGFVQHFEKRLSSGRYPRPAVLHHPRKRKRDENRGYLLSNESKFVFLGKCVYDPKFGT